MERSFTAPRYKKGITAADGRNDGRLIARRLSDCVFHHVFPRLARAVAAAAPTTLLADVRDAALVLLYRLLFVLWANDRNIPLTGDTAIGLPPCNGLFDPRRTPLMTGISIDDAVMADVTDALSFEPTPDGRTAIDYRNLSIQQLGGIYERLLELELVRDGAEIVVRPDIAARRSSGSYYTPDDLVALIMRETISPLIAEKMAAFRANAESWLDPASLLLDLKICDPAMGAGHFLVGLVDYLADQVIAAMTEAEADVARRNAGGGEASNGGCVSPLRARIAAIRSTIAREAEARGVAADRARLDDRHIIRRMVAARCVYGVDKNPMAVELAKAALQLHTFIPGAPPVFLDHHLRCGDSLFGLWVRQGTDKAAALGAPALLEEPVARARSAAEAFRTIDELNDAAIPDASRPADLFAAAQEMTAPLDVLLSLLHAFEWLDAGKDERAAILDANAPRHAGLLHRAKQLIAGERFLNWEVAFPDVWSGGFDAVIGNPPWDRMKLQQVEWFAARRRDIAMAPRAADRARMIAALEEAGDPLAQAFAAASARAEAAARMARACGDYPLLSGGDINLYALFVERAMALVKPRGLVGLLVPSGIASDKTAAKFFQGVATGGRLKALYDFENRRARFGGEPFFPDVDSRFKFCVFVASPEPLGAPTQCAFFLQDVSELADPERCLSLTAEDFARVNPNTGTAPLFRSRRDADLTTAIYRRLPVLVDRRAPADAKMRSAGGGTDPATAAREVRTWPVRYMTMFHMTNDSHLFRTRAELAEKESAHPIGNNRWRSERGLWLPLYEGKMAQAFDHRAASVAVHPHNRHRPAQPEPATRAQHQDPAWLPEPQYWVEASRCGWRSGETWVLGFKEITSPTNARTVVAALFPAVAFGNKIPLLRSPPPHPPPLAGEGGVGAHLLCANLNSIVFDFVARQKIQGQTLNRFIVEQLPVIPPHHYGRRFGAMTAAEIVRDAVLELTYTSNDMAPFAADMGFTDSAGAVGPPFAWDDERRLTLRAKLDAVYFHLYGVTGRDDVRHVYATFPLAGRSEAGRYGRHLSCDPCLAWMDALEAGEPGADIAV